MEATFFAALQYVADVKRMIAGDDQKTYYDFIETLKKYSRRNIDSSVVISTVETLFHKHYPNLLDGFKPFVPRDSAAAPAAEEEEDRHKRTSVDFLNRVRARLGDRAYRKFLDTLHDHARAKISAAAVRNKAVRLFGGNDDLVREFTSFLPEEEGSRKRKRTGCSEPRQRRVKRRGGRSDTSRSGEEIAAVQPRRTARRLMAGEEKAAKRVADRDNAMEDSLCAIEVRIKNLKASRKSAKRLRRRLSDGRVSPADVCLDKHFTALNLACIRSFHAKFLEDADVDLGGALRELLDVLKKKKKALQKERDKIAQRWQLIRD